MNGGKKLNVGGWEPAETGGTKAKAGRHTKLRFGGVQKGRTVLESFEDLESLKVLVNRDSRRAARNSNSLLCEFGSL